MEQDVTFKGLFFKKKSLSPRCQVELDIASKSQKHKKIIKNLCAGKA